MNVMLRQEQYFIEHKRYAKNFLDLGFRASPYAIDADGTEVSLMAKSRVYLIDLTTKKYSYTLYAKPQLSQVEDHLCATLTLNSLGIKAAMGAGPPLLCW